jgi:Rrf2 family protein
MARAEGMPLGYLAKVLQRLAKTGFVRSVKGHERGYVFARPPGKINLLELFEAMEGEPLFDDCPLRHCACGGTSQNCDIFAQWLTATRKLKETLAETTIASTAWNHPEHRFNVLPSLAAKEKVK